MTDLQKNLIAAIEAKRMKAAFNGDFLNVTVDITSGGKVKKQKFSFVFDDAEGVYGARIVPGSCRGAYAEHFAREVFELICQHSDAAGKLAI